MINSTTYGPGVLPVNFAPMHDGLEGTPQLALALAANFSSLSGGLTGGSSSSPLVLSGLVQIPKTPFLFGGNPTGATCTAGGTTNCLDFTNAGGTTAGAFMNVPASATWNPTSAAVSGTPARSLTFTEVTSTTTQMVTGMNDMQSAAQAGPTPDMHRLDITDTATGVEWEIYAQSAPSGSTTQTITVPSVPAGFTDDPVAVTKPTVTLQNVSLKLQSGVTYQTVFTFAGDTTDNLTAETDSFSVYGIQ
jgi:hypothetical protein